MLWGIERIVREDMEGRTVGVDGARGGSWMGTGPGDEDAHLLYQCVANPTVCRGGAESRGSAGDTSVLSCL